MHQTFNEYYELRSAVDYGKRIDDICWNIVRSGMSLDEWWKVYGLPTILEGAYSDDEELLQLFETFGDWWNSLKGFGLWGNNSAAPASGGTGGLSPQHTAALDQYANNQIQNDYDQKNTAFQQKYKPAFDQVKKIFLSQLQNIARQLQQQYANSPNGRFMTGAINNLYVNAAKTIQGYQFSLAKDRKANRAALDKLHGGVQQQAQVAGVTNQILKAGQGDPSALLKMSPDMIKKALDNDQSGQVRSALNKAALAMNKKMNDGSLQPAQREQGMNQLIKIMQILKGANGGEAGMAGIKAKNAAPMAGIQAQQQQAAAGSQFQQQRNAAIQQLRQQTLDAINQSGRIPMQDEVPGAEDAGYWDQHLPSNLRSTAAPGAAPEGGGVIKGAIPPKGSAARAKKVASMRNMMRRFMNRR